MQKNDTLYDNIGKNYDATRNADSAIVNYLFDYLNPTEQGTYLDIGCGSGNYTCALTERNLKITGVDISVEMLTKAKIKNSSIEWVHGDAMKLPFDDKFFEGAICTLATHHFKNLAKAFQEANRVLKKGNFIIFTSTPEQMNRYWLCHYFPEMIAKSIKSMQSFETNKQLLEQAGFSNIESKLFYVTQTVQDLFLYSGKYRPQIYLNPKIRAGISSFATLCPKDEEERGLKELEKDIASGKIKQVIQSYENNEGDYSFIRAQKT